MQCELHAEFVHTCNDCQTFIQGVWWSGEAHGYHEDGNSQNVRIWSGLPPEAVDKPPLHSPKLTIGMHIALSA